MQPRSTSTRTLVAMAVSLVLLFTAACGSPGTATETGVPPGNSPTATGESQELPTNTPAVTADSQVSPIEVSPLPTPTAATEDPPVGGKEAEDMIALARADLAGRLGLPEEAIVVGSVEEVVWPDASLGCPQPGVSYAQVLTPGFRVVLETAGATYHYHADQGKTVVLCDNPPSSGTPSQGKEPNVDDGWPNQSIGDDAIIEPPAGRKP